MRQPVMPSPGGGALATSAGRSPVGGPEHQGAPTRVAQRRYELRQEAKRRRAQRRRIAASVRRWWSGATADADVSSLLHPDCADLLDRALTSLDRACLGQGCPSPEIGTITVTKDRVALQVVGSPLAPPEPWLAQPLGPGITWCLNAGAVPWLPEGGRPSTSRPGLVPVATLATGGADVMVDLEYAAGPVCLSGDQMVATGLARSIVASLVTQPWSRQVRLIAVGMERELRHLAPDRFIGCPDFAGLSEVLDRIDDAAARPSIRGMARDDVLVGAWSHAGDDRPLTVVLLAVPPPPGHAEKLAHLTRDWRSRIAVLHLAAGSGIPDARWIFTCADDGRLTLGPLGLDGMARQLDAGAAADLADALRRSRVLAGERR